METTIQTTQLVEFRQSLHQFFNNRADTLMDLVDALASNVSAQSVVQLSLSPHFRPDYSTLFRGIADYFRASDESMAASERREQERQIMRLIMPYLPPPRKRKFWLIGVDATPWRRQFAPTLADRGYVYYPNAIKGNKPVTVGHQYSLLALLPEKEGAYAPAWLVPLGLRRIGTDEDKEMVGAEQVDMLMEDPSSPLADDLTVQVADTAYSKPAYLHSGWQHENLVTIVRARSNRVFYRQFVPAEGAKKSSGHPRWYGDRFDLKDPSTWHEADEVVRTTHDSRRGRHYKVEIEVWRDMVMTGKWDIPMHKHPFTLVRIRLFDEEGNLAFRRPMWLLVCGKRRNELTPLDIYHAYQQRYDLEHFFRFGKQRLLLDKFQTPEVEREESWAHLVLLAYVQLWLARPLTKRWPRPWERYLPVVNEAREATPTLVQRDLGRIIREIGTPASPPKPQNNARGRVKGTKLPPRPRIPVVYKGAKETKLPP
jgi:DDE superfamily endonuclease